MKYFAMIDGEQRGPFELNQLADAGVRPSTYVWCKGMADWEKAEDVADVCRMFRNRIHDLMHPNSVAALHRQNPLKNRTTNEGEGMATSPSRYDRYLQDTNQMPTLEEIESRQDLNTPPPSMTALAILATVLFFPPTGFVAIYFAIKSNKEWKAGNHAVAHDLNRSAKMWTGITCFLGLILYAALFRFL